jgi:FixJ family two-component response regulator
MGESVEKAAPTVFVVDDDRTVRQALAGLLRARGMQVETFASAREFLGSSRPDGPACLLLEVRLAGENGLMVQEALRAVAHAPPIIFLTGYGTVPLAVQAMKAGAVDFLQKPVEAPALQAAIAIALAQDARARDRQHHQTELRQRFATLTPREREVLGLITSGLLNKEMAYVLGTTEKTIKTHRCHIKQKMQAGSVAHLVRMVLMVEMDEPQTAPPQPCRSTGEPPHLVWNRTLAALKAAREHNGSRL